MKKLIFFIMGVACVLSSCHAQPSSKESTEVSLSKITPLKIGDTVPDITIKNIINYPKKEIKLYDLNGKLVILDFFATWCSSCIAALPKLDTLQKKFGNKIQIFVVDYENDDKVRSFLLHNPISQKVLLPFITSDTLLDKFFPHQSVPHEVWITSDGVLKATTAAYEVNKENISYLLAGKEVSFKIKSDVVNFSMRQPLFFNRRVKVNKDNIRYYSIVSGFIDGIPVNSFIKRDTNHLIRRICFTNASIKQLYKFAFNISWYDNRCILDVKDTDAIEFSNGNFVPWAIQHAYCYELFTPPTMIEKVRKKMQQDLTNNFGYHAGVETRKVKCLVLTINKGTEIIASKGGEPKHNFSNNKIPKFISNQPISKLVDYLNYALPIPVIDETNFSSPIDLQLPKDLSNIDSLKFTLYKYGFDLKESEKMIDVFVLSDK